MSLNKHTKAFCFHSTLFDSKTKHILTYWHSIFTRSPAFGTLHITISWSFCKLILRKNTASAPTVFFPNKWNYKLEVYTRGLDFYFIFIIFMTKLCPLHFSPSSFTALQNNIGQAFSVKWLHCFQIGLHHFISADMSGMSASSTCCCFSRTSNAHFSCLVRVLFLVHFIFLGPKWLKEIQKNISYVSKISFANKQA